MPRIPPVTSPVSQTLDAALTQFESILTTHDWLAGRTATIEDVRSAALEIEGDLAVRDCLRNMRRLEPLFSGMKHYSMVMATLCDGTLSLPWIWAPITFILQRASEYVDAFEKIMVGYSRIGQAMKRFTLLINPSVPDHFASDQVFQESLAAFYSNILQFHGHTYKALNRSGWKVLFLTSWGRLERRFDHIFSDLEYHGNTIDRVASAMSADDIQTVPQELREWKDRSLKTLETIGELENGRNRREHQAILSWLDYDELEQIQIMESISGGAKYLQAHSWFTQHPTSMAWLKPSSGPPILWLQGFPESGKSYICVRTVYDLVESRIRVIRYFCSYSHKSSLTFEQILRSLLMQVISADSDKLTLVYQHYVLKRKLPETAKLEILLGQLSKIGTQVSKQPAYVWVVIDGLDKCDRDTQLRTTKLLRAMNHSALSDEITVYKSLISVESTSPSLMRAMDDQLLLAQIPILGTAGDSLSIEKSNVDDSLDREDAGQRTVDYDSSDSSDIESVISSQSDISSASSLSTAVQGSDLCKQLAHLLLSDREVDKFYKTALLRHNPINFVERMNNIIVRYLRDMRHEMRDRVSKTSLDNLPRTDGRLVIPVIRTLERMERRQQVTSSVIEMANDNETRKDREKNAHTRRLQEYLSKVEIAGSRNMEMAIEYQKIETQKEQEVYHASDIYERRDAEAANSEVVAFENEKNRPQKRKRVEYESEVDEDSDTDMDSAEEGDTSKEAVSIRTLESLFSTGQPFELLKARLEYLASPPASLSAALQSGGISMAVVFLERRFRQAATGEYEWLTHLKSMGYSKVEMAELLYQESHDTPWIYFDSTASQASASPPLAPSDVFHLEGCAHKPLLDGPTVSPFRENNYVPDNEDEIKRSIEKLCGLCGVSPCSRDPSVWNGSVKFHAEQDGLSAIISHSIGNDGVETTGHKILRLLRVADGMQAAAALMQDAGFCCQSFTILTATDDSFQTRPPVIYLRRFEFRIITAFAERLRLLREHNQSHSDAESDVEFALLDLEGLAAHVLNTLCTTKNRFGSPGVIAGLHRIIHLASLAIQALGIGILAYLQAHIGEIRPFFLDTSLRKIELVGMNSPDSTLSDGDKGIFLHLMRFTCLDGMVGRPLMVFSTSTTSSHAETAFDLCGKLEDVLDTWGPGQIVYQNQEPQLPVAIRIGNGFIGPSSTDDNSDRFHWGHGLPRLEKQQGLDLQQSVVIGTLIEANSKCNNKMAECWEKSLHLVRPIGTHGSYSETAAHELQLQGGAQGFNVGYVNVREKRPGITVKDKYFRPPGYPSDNALIQYLDEHWAVRVSYCTLVAQRVRLRQMIGDLFPTFAKTYDRKHHRQTWCTLQGNLVEEFNGPNASLQSLKDWLSDLDEASYSFVLLVSKAIIKTLVDTGLSPDGQSFHVAWPYKHETYKGIRVPVDETTTKWLPILEDSKDSATFAYITNVCLETQGAPCRGSIPALADRVLLLETAVSCHTREPPPLWTLCHEKMYYFERTGNIARFAYWVKVEKDANAADKPTTLVRVHALERMKPAFALRLIEKLRGEEPKIRETGYSIGKAETVRILSRELF